MRDAQAVTSTRWIVQLRTRSFSLKAERDRIRREPDLMRKRALIQGLRDMTRLDHAAFRTFVEGLGGRVLHDYWHADACLVEAPPAAIGAISLHAAYVAHWEVTSRNPSTVRTPAVSAPVPIGTCTDVNNHKVAAAWQLIGRGAGTSPTPTPAVVAFFDTGLDLDQGDGTRHDAFDDAQGNSRLIDSFFVTAGMGTEIDCNTIHPYCPFHANPPPNWKHKRSALHGTGVASIAVGEAILNVSAAGHAPEAQAVGFSVTWDGGVNTPTWRTDDPLFLAAIEKLREELLADGHVDVLNVSFDGWSDPNHITQIELDQLERDWDILVITSAGNAGDETFESNGYYNGLSVGAVHTRGGPSEPFWPMRLTSRGPLFSDPTRFYPDVCATGAKSQSYPTDPNCGTWTAQIVMPSIDFKDDGLQGSATSYCRCILQGYSAKQYVGMGTSLAAPQVSGAAALYRGYRSTETALETKAAILLTVVDCFPAVWTAPLTGWDGQHTYRNRNTYGVGYVRDDELADYALRQKATDLGTSITLSTANPTQTVTYPNLTSGNVYAVAIAWPRVWESESWSGAMPRANVDLQIVNPTTQKVLARSETPSNSYERLVFEAPAGLTAVTIRVVGKDMVGLTSLPVYVAARETSSPVRAATGTVEVLDAGAGCVATAPDNRVDGILPSSYEGAYGSWAFTGSAQTRYSGLKVQQQNGVLYGNRSVFNIVYDVSVAGPARDIGGLALRTWRPFLQSNQVSNTIIVKDVRLYLAGGVNPGLAWPPPSYGVSCAQDVPIEVFPPNWSAQRWDTWTIRIPFTTKFHYDGTSSLGIWLDIERPDGLWWFEVDAVKDSGSLYAMRDANPTTQTQYGTAPILGLFDDAPTQVAPILHAYGEPASDHGLLFHVERIPGTVATLVIGGPDSVMIGNCNVLSNGGAGSVPLTVNAGAAYLPLDSPIGTSMLYADVYFQVATVSGPDVVLSNGLRLKFGGDL